MVRLGGFEGFEGLNDLPARARRAKSLLSTSGERLGVRARPEAPPLEPGPHRTMPAGSAREAIFHHLRQTQSPETLPGIVFSPPPLNIRHEKIGDFQIELPKRLDRAFVPCSLCSNGKPKFTKGSFLWSDDGYIRTIGNCCAVEFFASLSGGFRMIERRHERREQVRRAEEFLMVVTPLMGVMFDYLHAVNGAAFDAGTEAKRFRRRLPSLAKPIADAAKRGGLLQVARRVSEVAPEPAGAPPGVVKRRFEWETIGSLVGGSFAFPNYEPQRKAYPILGNIVKFSPLGPPPRNDEEAMEFLTALTEDEMVARARTSEQIVSGIRSLAGSIQAAWDFMTDANLEQISLWGRHPQSEVRFETEYSRNSIRFDGQHGQHVVLSREPFQIPLPALPAEIIAIEGFR